jgi:shikimate dehydrogenase
MAYNQRVSGPSIAMINASTRVCAVFGHPVRHSASPAMHNAALDALGLNWRYLAAAVHPDDLAAAIAGARAMRYLGVNLTVPHKVAALEMLEVVSAKARLLGAVNTIVFEARGPAGEWTPLGRNPEDDSGPLRSHGHNTDAVGLARSLKEDFQWSDLRGATVLLLGAGGAARAAALQLAEEGIARLFLVNRTAARAEELAGEVSTHFPALKITANLPGETVDLVVNATSLGLKPNDPAPLESEWLRTHRPARVYDMIYRPAETALLREAKNAGCRTANGLGMLLYQGAAALELWCGRPAPVEIMRAALQQHIYV